MQRRDLAIEGAFELTPRVFPDDRGLFLEWYRAEDLVDGAGHPLTLAQANCSVSRAGTLRGIHFADVPPGQAKYVTCLSGSVFDVVVDVRVGSPTFGRWDSVLLDDVDRRAVYIPEGLGHAFLALGDGSVVAYLCSTGYSPGAEHGVHPLDPEIGIDWPTDVAPLLSPKDAAAPSLADALGSGLLPDLEACRARTASLTPPVAR